MRDKILVGIALTLAVGLVGCSVARPDSDKAGVVQTGSDGKSTLLAQEEQAQANARLAQEEQEQARLRLEQAEKERIKASIEDVLQQDSKTTEEASSASVVVGRMRAIDTSSCPSDFREAYNDHIYAWEAMTDVERDADTFKSEANSGGVVVETLIRGFLGDPLGKANEMHEAQTELEHRYQDAHQQIRQTFQQVEDLAIRHGANLQH